MNPPVVRFALLPPAAHRMGGDVAADFRAVRLPEKQSPPATANRAYLLLVPDGTGRGAAAFEVKDSRLSANYTNENGIFEPEVWVTAKGRTSEAMQKDVPPRKYATKLPLMFTE